MAVELGEPIYRCLSEGNSPHGTEDPLAIMRYVVIRDGWTRMLAHSSKHVGCSGADGDRRADHPNRDGCFNHGYAGSGPSELARAILRDYLQLEPDFPHPSLYQAFKSVYVARFPQGRGWTLTGEEIRTWLRLETVRELPWVEPPSLAGSLDDQYRARDAEYAARARVHVERMPDDDWQWLVSLKGHPDED